MLYVGFNFYFLQAEPTTETIDMEKLKQQDEIGFYAQITLYEDELADHGCAEVGRFQYLAFF